MGGSTTNQQRSLGPQDPGKLMKLEGAVIAVTGGASGLGAATAQLCVERGAKVAVLDMNKEIFLKGKQLP